MLVQSRPKGCTHPTCEAGECRKCPHNPKSSSPYHFESENSDPRPITLPAPLAVFIGIVSGLIGVKFCIGPNGWAGLVAGGMVVVFSVVMSLCVILQFSPNVPFGVKNAEFSSSNNDGDHRE